MRTKIMALVAGCILAACNSTSTVSATGGVDGSGGDAAKSTIVDVKTEMVYLKEKLKIAFHRFSIIKKEEAAQTFSKTLSYPSSFNAFFDQDGGVKNLFSIIDQTTFNQTMAACPGEGGTHKEAAVTSKDTVCFSVTLLTRIPHESLELQLIALATHEIGHILGLSEDDAVEVQYWVLANTGLMLPQQQKFADLYAKLANARLHLRILQSVIIDRATQPLVCQLSGVLIHAVQQVQSTYQQVGGSADALLVSHALYKNLQDIMSETSEITGYCYSENQYVSKTSNHQARQGVVHDTLKLLERIDFVSLSIDDYKFILWDFRYPGLVLQGSGYTKSGTMDIHVANALFDFLNQPSSQIPENNISDLHCTVSDNGTVIKTLTEDDLISATDFLGKYWKLELQDLSGANRDVYLTVEGAKPLKFSVEVDEILLGNRKSNGLIASDFINSKEDWLYGFSFDNTVTAVLQKGSVTNFSFKLAITSKSANSQGVTRYALACTLN